MNRTALILSAAGLLALLALVAAPRPEAPKPPAVATATSATTATPDDAAPGPALAPEDKRVPEPASAGDSEGVRLTGKLASGYVANGGAPNYLSLEVQAPVREEAAPTRTPANLVVVIDRSCSMSGQKMQDALQAAHALVDQLDAEDRLAVVHYGSDVSALRSTRADGGGKEALHQYIRTIRVDGSTNISGGLERALVEGLVHREAYRTNRVVLLSDGQPTMGEVTQEGLTRVVTRMREHGLTVTSLGVGADFDERLMGALAEAGGGFYGYISDTSRLAEVFARELQQASELVARDVELRLSVPAGVRVEEVLGRSFAREGNGARLKLYDLSSGLSNRLVVRFSVDKPAGETPPETVKAEMRWTDVASGGRKVAAVSLTGQVTAVAKRALDHADEEVMAHAANAEAARQVQLAAALARQGKRDEAERSLNLGFDNIRKMFGASANALAGSTIEDSRKALQSGDMNRAAKEMDRKSIESFGQNNAY